MVKSKITKTTVLKEMDFDGDIIITDPCYLGNPRVKSIINNTIYGDWSCHVWKASNYSECTEENVLGQFCADSGMVTVADWNAVKEQNPGAEEFVKEHPWCATVITDFKGTVQIVQINKEYEIKGHKYKDSYIELFGKGNINWIAAQTGF